MSVQRQLVTDFGAGENTTTASITAVVVANSFAKLNNLRHMSAGPTAGTADARNNDDLGCSCLLTDPTTVSFERQSGGVDEDVSFAFEVIELPSSGNDEVIVRMHQNITLGSGVSTSDTDIASVTTIGDLVPIICGVRSSSTGSSMDRESVTVEIIDDGGAKIRLTRLDNAGTVVTSVAVLEFVGSNYAVQQNIAHTQAVVNTIETEPVASVVWGQTIIFGSVRGDSASSARNYTAAWPGATSTTIKFLTGSTFSRSIVHLVSNANLTVEHIDSFDGSELIVDSDNSDPMQVDKTVSASTLADHFVIVHADAVNNDSTHAHWVWNYYLTSTTNLRFWVCRSSANSDLDWAAQLIDISGLGAAGGTSVSNTAIVPIEALQGISGSRIPAYEANETAAAARAALLEALQTLSAGRTEPIEASSSLQASRSVQIEALTGVDAALAEAFEALADATSAATVTVEALLSVLQGRSPGLEALASPTAARQVIIEALADASAGRQTPFEALGQALVSNEAISPIEALAALSVQAGEAFESPAGVDAQRSATVESLQSIEADRSGNIEALSAISINPDAGFESLASLQAGVLPPIEASAGLLLSIVAAIESPGFVQALPILQIEATATVSLSSLPIFEALQGASATVTLSEEVLGRIAQLAGLPFEALLNPAAVTVTNVVAREVRFQLKLRKDAKFAQTVKRDVEF